METTVLPVLGLTLKEIDLGGRADPLETVLLYTECGREFRMSHSQDCCEEVRLESVDGDIGDLIGAPLLMAEKVTNEEPCGGLRIWTFYKFATVKGYVTFRFLGESNGYYSVDVDFKEFRRVS